MPLVDPPTDIQFERVGQSSGERIRVTWSSDPRARKFHVALYKLSETGGVGHFGSWHVMTEQPVAALPAGWFDSGSRYLVEITAYSSMVVRDDGAIAPFAVPLEHGFATTISSPFVAE